ncbi:hypothetical protein ELI36_03200 [Rhizobium ruizarguesonis]|nr:hypothetical protein ELI36_03200 [Rhizobium ruizarguesonis]TAV36301.1 hypothetical protein ELI33_03190 [Rhizobium ruizarguesonis]
MWSPFVLSKQTESQLADFTQLFFGQALRRTVLSKSHRNRPKNDCAKMTLLFRITNVRSSNRGSSSACM